MIKLAADERVTLNCTLSHKTLNRRYLLSLWRDFELNEKEINDYIRLDILPIECWASILSRHTGSHLVSISYNADYLSISIKL